MTGKTHALAGCCAGLAVMTYLCPTYLTMPEAISFVPMCLVGSLVPDIDMPKSTCGKIVPPISKFINTIFGHRTITHSLAFWSIFFVICYQLFPYSQMLLLAFGIGIATHLFLDLFNKSGEALFYPITSKISLASISLCGRIEHIIRFSFSCGSLYFLYQTALLYFQGVVLL